MNKRTIITIIIATILALIFALLFLNKNETETVENKTVIPEEVVVQEETVDEQKTEDLEEKNIEEKPVQQVVKTYSKPSAQKTVKNEETPVFDQIVVQEGSVVEEAEPDYGIRKVGDTVEITREFKVKSPVKYSFKDFGILDKVTTK